MCSLSLKVVGNSSLEWVVNRWGTPPSLSMRKISKLPSRLEAKASFCPSGDQTGRVSCAGWVVN